MTVNDDVSLSGRKEYPMFKTIEAQPECPTLGVPSSVSARLVSYEELREAGWSKRMIVKFLGAAWRAYPLDAVETAEALPHFRAAWLRAARTRS
jgi:hypothetical protein